MKKLTFLSVILINGLFAPWLAAAEKTLEVVRFPERRNVELRMIHSSRVPTATMKAKFHFQEGQMRIEVSYTKMKPAVLFGGEITSFVLWAVSRDGKAENLGELWVRPKSPNDSRRFSTGQRTFALMVTAEPYYQIDKPSDALIFWNGGSQDPQAPSSPISFTDLGEPSQMAIQRLDFVKYDGKTPLDVLQAEKTYEIAERMKAGDYASALMANAMTTLQQSRQMARSSSSRKGAQDYARRSVASSNEAIRITLRRLEAEQLDAEIQQRRAEISELEQRAGAAENRARKIQEQADQQLKELEDARVQMTRIRAERDSLNQATVELKSQREALTLSISDLESSTARLRSEKESLAVDKQKTEDRLQAALSQVADTRESARGLILNLPDILFDVNKATLKTELKIVIAKLAGILLIMPEHRVRIEGHTDSTGSEEHNLKLSGERAQSVLGFLAEQGIDDSRLKAVGYGLTRPIADNDTREGRQKNRRVEIIISDQEIGEE